jgi:uncharacterized protein YjaG (DUF416 family)
MKQPEKYYHAVLMLYLPWRNEECDLLGNHETYSHSFHLHKCELEKNLHRFEMDCKEIDQALEVINEQGIPEDVWDKVLNSTEQANFEDKLEGPVPSKDHIDPDDLEINTLP